MHPDTYCIYTCYELRTHKHSLMKITTNLREVIDCVTCSPHLLMGALAVPPLLAVLQWSEAAPQEMFGHAVFIFPLAEHVLQVDIAVFLGAVSSLH